MKAGRSGPVRRGAPGVADEVQELDRFEELRRVHDLNEKIFAAAPMILLIQSPTRRVLDINTFGSELLGYSEAELLGTDFVTLLAEEAQHGPVSRLLQEVMSGHRAALELVAPIRCVDGSVERISWRHVRLWARRGGYILSMGLPEGRERPSQDTAPNGHPKAGNRFWG
jgi:PAS domain-containing protein